MESPSLKNSNRSKIYISLTFSQGEYKACERMGQILINSLTKIILKITDLFIL
jgi:hypothetical protein